ncbi:hypothetical protein U1Q18_008040 [Sarracenia purpurea var. burkii]
MKRFEQLPKNNAVKMGMEFSLGFPFNEGSKEAFYAKVTEPMSISKILGAKAYGQQTGEPKGKETLHSSWSENAPVLRNSEEIATDDNRAEKGEGVDGNSSNKERNGRWVVSEEEKGAALDAVFMDVDLFRISKGGNSNFCSNHKPP